MSKLAVKKYFSFMFISVTILVMFLTFVGLYGGDVNPAGNTARALLCFALPVLIICNTALLLYWLCFRKWLWAIIPVITLLFCIKYIGSIYQFRSLPNETEKTGIKIATYNVGSFGQEASGYIAEDVLSVMKNEKVDILCMQEYYDSEGEVSNSVNFRKYFPYMAIGNQDMVIFSRYPIKESKAIVFEQSNNSALWADINIKGKVVRLYNVHMETTGVNSALHHAAKIQMSGGNVSSNSLLYGIYNNYMFGLIVRAGQAAIISNDKHNTDKPKILCGDFNDVPYSYVYNTLLGDMVDGFRECGSGFMHTFRGKKMFRIDYIFHDQSMKGITYYKKDITYSDHYPVFMKLSID